MPDNDDFILSKANIAIIGLGLMGGSLALALKGKCRAIFGIDPDDETRDLALRQNIVDSADEDPANILAGVDLVVLAAPVPAILTLLETLGKFTQNRCIVMDLGSTKVLIAEKMEKLAPWFDPIGCHPICGKEKLGLENADRALYYLAPFIVTPLERTTQKALSAVRQIAEAIGAKITYLSPAEHDRILANTSHVPFLLSSALVLATPLALAPYIGPGFKSASRLAATPASMMLGVILSNRENVLAILEQLQDELALFAAAIAENDIESLESSLTASQEAYSKLILRR